MCQNHELSFDILEFTPPHEETKEDSDVMRIGILLGLIRALIEGSMSGTGDRRSAASSSGSRSRVWFTALFLIPILASTSPGTPLRGMDPARGMDAIARPVVDEGDVLGLSIAVVRGDSVLFAKGYGYSDLERRTPCDEHSIYWIASVTKMFTAATVLRMMEQGSIDLDHSLTRYLPELGSRWDSVTVRHSLNHTSGIPDFVIASERRALDQGLPTDDAFTLAWTKAADPSFPCGARWSYTNTAFHLAGIAGERASGEPFEVGLARAITRPLELSRTGFAFSDSLRGKWRVYHFENDSIAPFRLYEEFPFFTDGGMVSTVLEVAKTLRGLFQGRILQSASLEQMTRPTDTSCGAIDYGLGVRLGSLDRHSKWGHTGGHDGILAAAAYYPDDSLAVVVLLNTDGSVDATDIEARVARLWLGIPAPTPSEIRLAPADMEEIAGIYEMRGEGLSMRYEIFVENGQLIERRLASDSQPVPLRHIGGEVFANSDWGETRLVSKHRARPCGMLIETWGGFFGDVAYRVRQP